MSKRLFLLDAYALIYRAYYAFQKTPILNSKGENNSAIFGFVNTLEDVLRREDPTHIAVAFDPAGPTFRHEAYEAYKAQRPETPEDIRRAVPIIKEIIRAYNIDLIEVAGFEADDVIGTLAKQAEKLDYTVYMMTPDKDYGQLVSDRVFIYKPKFGASGFDTLGVEDVIRKFDIARTEQVIDMLGLMGDTSDNIPGCPGVGEKTASKLIAEFDSIENLLENTDKLKGALRDKITTNREQILFSKFLATIKVDVPVTLDETTIVRSEPDKEVLTKLFEGLEFRSFVARLNRSDDAPTTTTKAKAAAPSAQQSLFGDTAALSDAPAAPSHYKTIATVAHSYRAMTTDTEIDELIALLEESSAFAFDTETTTLNTLTTELVGMSFAVEAHKAFYVPIPSDRSEADALLGRFAPLLSSDERQIIGQNIKFDLAVLASYGITLGTNIFDTMVAHYLLQPDQRHHMDYLSEVLLGYQTVHIDALIGAKGKGQGSMRDVPIDEIAQYAAEDADITLQLKEKLAPQLAENGLEELFYTVEMPLIPVLARIERNGVLIDDFALAQSSETLTAEMQRLEREIRQAAGYDVNVSSPKQIGELLFERLKVVEKAKKTKTGQYVTDEETLEALRSRHPIIPLILDFRGLKKLLSTYIDALPKLIEPSTGKIHTSYNQTVAATGRLSSSNPNLQNIPIRDEQGKEIRKAFIAEPDCLFVAADYSQVELRIMAHLSGDTQMLDAFAHGQDIHAATAAKIYHLPIEEVSSAMRRKAKTANFGIIYGISPFGLAERLSIPRTEAKELIDGYFETFPQVKAYMDQSIEQARHDGYVETLMHRRRYLPDISSHNANVRGFAERNAINAPIQGSAADIIKLAMIRIDAELQRRQLATKMILQVHDELDFNVPTNELDEVRAIITKEMEGAADLRVPLKVDIGVGRNWLEAH